MSENGIELSKMEIKDGDVLVIAFDPEKSDYCDLDSWVRIAKTELRETPIIVFPTNMNPEFMPKGVAIRMLKSQLEALESGGHKDG